MEVDLRQVVRAAMRLWKTLVAVIVIMAVIGYAVGSILPKEYSATTQLLVPQTLTGVSAITSGNPTTTYQTLISSGPVLDRVIIELGLDMTRDELEQKISTNVVGGTQIIELTVTDGDPQVAADITNAVARHFEVQIVDLTTGEYQRNLDNLRQQSDNLEAQITVLDTRLGEIDVPENQNDSQVQAEIRQLRSDRLQLSQNKADIDAAIRSLTSQLSMSSAPLVVADVAQPSDAPESSPAILLALLGAFVGGLIGIAYVVLVGLRDRVFRNETQIVSMPLLAKSDTGTLSPEVASVVNARIEDLRENNDWIGVVSAGNSQAVSHVVEVLNDSLGGSSHRFVAIENLLGNADAVRKSREMNGIIVLAQVNETEVWQLEEIHNLVSEIEPKVHGSIVLQ